MNEGELFKHLKSVGQSADSKPQKTEWSLKFLVLFGVLYLIRVNSPSLLFSTSLLLSIVFLLLAFNLILEGALRLVLNAVALRKAEEILEDSDLDSETVMELVDEKEVPEANEEME